MRHMVDRYERQIRSMRDQLLHYSERLKSAQLKVAYLEAKLAKLQAANDN